MSKKEKNRIYLDSLPKTNVFKVPEGYFVSLPSEIDKKIVENNSVLKTNIFKTPEGYFDTLSEKVAAKLPSNETIHSVPEGYFDSLPDKIQEKINREKLFDETPIIQLIPVVRYSIAAGFIGILMLSSVFLYNLFTSNGTGIAKKETIETPLSANTLIAALSKEDIKKYLESEGNVDVHQLMEFSSPVKKEKIRKEFEKTILNVKLKEKEKKEIELELNDIDLTELYPEI